MEWPNGCQRNFYMLVLFYLAAFNTIRNRINQVVRAESCSWPKEVRTR